MKVLTINWSAALAEGSMVGAAALTVSKTKVFKPLRSWLDRKVPWWGSQLASCWWCLGHWASALATPILGLPVASNSPWVVNWLASVVLVVALSGPTVLLAGLAMREVDDD